MGAKYYEGETIYFRAVELDDAPVLHRWINDPSVWSTLGHRAPIKLNHEREWIEQRKDSSEDVIFGIVDREADRLVGTVGLHSIHPINRRGTLGILIGEADERDKGYGSAAIALVLRYAFEELNLHRVQLDVFGSNPRAIRVYEKCGFVHEGTERAAMWRHGAFHDILKYGLLREEWLALQEQDTGDRGECERIVS